MISSPDEPVTPFPTHNKLLKNIPKGSSFKISRQVPALELKNIKDRKKRGKKNQVITESFDSDESETHKKERAFWLSDTDDSSDSPSNNYHQKNHTKINISKKIGLKK